MNGTAAAAKQKRLPGTEDAAIEELESAAEQYVKVRDRRMKLTTEESEQEQNLLTLMRKNSKEVYSHNGIEIEVVKEDAKVKVRIVKDGEDEE